MGLKETRDINIFNTDDDLKYSGLSVWKNNILMVNIGQQVSDDVTGSNDISHQYALPLLQLNTAATDSPQNTIKENDVEQLQHLQRTVDQSQEALLNHSSQFNLVDADHHQQAQVQSTDRQSEHEQAEQDYAEYTAALSALDVEPVTELDRYHQDYDEEKVRVRAIVEQHDQEPSTSAVATMTPVALSEADMEAEAAVSSEEAVIDTEAPVISEEAVIDTEAPVISEEEAVIDTEAPVISEEEAVIGTEAPVISEEAVIDTEAPVISEEEAVIDTEAPVISEEEAVIGTEAPVISEEAVINAEAPIASEAAVMQSEVELARTVAFQSEQDLIQPTPHPQHNAVETVIARESIDLDGLNIVDTPVNHQVPHGQFDHQDEVNHQKIIDTYRQIIEMYK